MMIEPFSVSSGMLSPDQFEIVNHVFREISGEPWFTDDTVRQQKFAALVVHSFQQGKQDPMKLMAYCRAMAEIKFARKGHPYM